MKLQVTIGGYAGGMVTLYAIHDQSTDVITVGKVGEFNRARFKDSLVVANVDVDAWDSQFSDLSMQEAVSAWHKRYTTNRLMFSDQAQRANPLNAIQVLKIEERGRKYEINESATSAQIAAIAACWQADLSIKITQAQAFGDDLQTLLRGGMLSI
ncbi:hypothetical protein [Nevskia sp.]|uniref:hypothetical protein n=1 Tax=Nevskia sp. TaxID=1929292 RepID=UPI0025EBE250|nr:hypothetical protein [Nevskia sp.]